MLDPLSQRVRRDTIDIPAIKRRNDQIRMVKKWGPRLTALGVILFLLVGCVANKTNALTFKEEMAQKGLLAEQQDTQKLQEIVEQIKASFDKASHELLISNQFKDVVYDLPDEKTTIGCFNKYTFEIAEPNQEKPEGQKCFLGGSGWQNISLPPKGHFPYFREWWSEVATINRLAIINFESGFDENASNPHAHGYVQTLRSYKVPKGIRSQLKWMYDAEQGWRGDHCAMYFDEPYTLYGNMYVEKGGDAWSVCRARLHFGKHNPGSKYYDHSVFYAKRYHSVTKFYIQYFFKK